MARPAILVSAAELAALIERDAVTVLDVRWRLDRPDDGPDDFRVGHLPRAVFVDLPGELAEHGAAATEGRHPLPAVSDLQASARRWGVRTGRAVVAYDATGNQAAARAWWLLRHGGVDDVRLLDGGLAAWVAAGLPLETGEAEPPGDGDVRLEYGGMPVLDLDGAAAFPATGSLLDARAGERYRGEAEPIDPRAGHIPGALSVPTAGNVGADGRFLPAEELRARFLAAGVDPAAPIATYCGSGVTAAHETAALAIAGFDAALFPGSWSQWSNHPDRPVATGA